MAGDPSAVCSAPEDVIIVDVHYPGGCLSGCDGISAVSVLNTLGLAGCAGGVEDEQPVFWIEHDGLALFGLALHEIIIIDIASLGHGYCYPGSLDDDYLLNGGCSLHCLIHIGLERQWLAAPVEAVSGDDNLGLSIVDPAVQAAGGESREDDGVNGSDLGACQHGDGQLWDHGEVSDDSVTLDYTSALEGIGHLVDLDIELAVGDIPGISNGLADKVVGDLVLLGPLGMPVHGIVGHIDLAAGEPLEVGLAGVIQDLGVGHRPVSIGLGHLVPKLNIIIRTPLAHLHLSLEALLLHPLICIGILNYVLRGVENPCLFLQRSSLCCFSQFHTSFKSRSGVPGSRFCQTWFLKRTL